MTEMQIPAWTFADRVRKVRRHARLDQRTFAAKLGVPTTTLASWETGRSEPRFSELAGLSAAVQREFRVPATWLLGIDSGQPVNSGCRTRWARMPRLSALAAAA